MTRPLAAHSRSIAKQTLLGVVAMLALVLGATVALAADGGETDEAETTETTETTDTSESTETSVDTSDTTDTTEADDTTETTETTDTTDPAPEKVEADPEVEDTDGFRNHGEAVSKAAREDCTPGPGHGACVSAVAKSNAGKKGGDDADEVETDDEEPDEVELEDGDTETGSHDPDKGGKPDKARGKR